MIAKLLYVCSLYIACKYQLGSSRGEIFKTPQYCSFNQQSMLVKPVIFVNYYSHTHASDITDVDIINGANLLF